VTIFLRSHELTAAHLSLHAGIARPHLLWLAGIPLGPCHPTACKVRHCYHHQHCFLLHNATQATLDCTNAYAVSDKPCQTWAGKVQRLKSQAAHDAPMHIQCATYESNLSGTAQYPMQLFKHLCMQAGMHNRSSCKCQGESPISCAHTYRQHMYKEGVPKRSELSAIGCFSSTDFPQHHTIAVHVHLFSATRLAQKHLQNEPLVMVNISLQQIRFTIFAK